MSAGKPVYGEADKARLASEISKGRVAESYRSPWRIDYARLVHCPAFRRLQGKTQLFPGESDFFRNRLTHSLEVAQIAKSIAIKLNHEHFADAADDDYRISPDLVEFAALAHDLGHPYKRSHLIALRRTKISASDLPLHCGRASGKITRWRSGVRVPLPQISDFKREFSNLNGNPSLSAILKWLRESPVK